jgi:hypothetical protein
MTYLFLCLERGISVAAGRLIRDSSDATSVPVEVPHHFPESDDAGSLSATVAEPAVASNLIGADERAALLARLVAVPGTFVY